MASSLSPAAGSFRQAEAAYHRTLMHPLSFAVGNVANAGDHPRWGTPTAGYPFNDPASNPRMKYRPSTTYTSTVGRAARSAPAICTFHSTM